MILECPNCKTFLETTDWTEHFTFNDEVFEIQCGSCDHYFDVKVDITPEYEIVREG